MTENSFDILAGVLRDRDLSYDRDALKAVCNDPNSRAAVQAWIEEYLSPETLLTKDEVTLYEMLTKTGEASALAAQDLSLIEGLNDQEIQEAIEELKRLTAAIEEKSEALRAQQSAMRALVKNDERTTQARSFADKGQVTKWESEKGQINVATEELSQSLAYQTADLDRRYKATEVVARQTVDGIFKADDKLLLSLQKLASDLESGVQEDDICIERIRELCARLIKHTVEGIRTKLDRIFLEGLDGSNGHSSKGQEVTDLQEELESLYSEILPVAQMSAEQQFLQPALRTISWDSSRSQEKTIKAFTYIQDCLLFLVERMEAFVERAKETQCHSMASQFVAELAKKELSHVEPSDKQPVSPVRPNTQRRRKSSTPQSPTKSRNTRRRSSGQLDEEIEPEQQLARHLGVNLPVDSASESSRVETFERIVSERKTRLGIHASSLDSTTESSISSHLSEARLTLQLLQDSLLAESPYHEIHLTDPEVEASVTTFEQDIQYLQQSLDEIDLQQLHTKNVHRDQIVERWSR